MMSKQEKSVFEKLYQPLFLLTIFMGLILRIRSFITGRSLWLDEAMLALNILNRSFGGLFQQPMEYGQSSPIGYVISVKAITLIFGDSEYSLRLYSLIAGCFALILIAIVSRNTLGKAGGLIALVLFAFNPDLIYYSSETKQYISDVITTLILIWLLQRQLRIQATKKDFVFLGIAGAIILWFSHPIVFVAAGVGITLFLHYWINKDRERQLATMLCGLAWGISLILLYFVNLRHLASSELLLSYWQEGFMELKLGWFVSIWQGFVEDPLGFRVNAFVVFVFFIVGLSYLTKQKWQMSSVIIITFTLAFIASGLHKYSLLGRMMLFAIPLIVIVITAGIAGIGSLFKHRYLSLALQILCILYFMWMPFKVSLDEFVEPTYREHIKPTLEYLVDYKRDGDLIYVYYSTGPAFRFYSPKFGLDKPDPIIGKDHSNEPENYYDEINALKGNGRVWFLFSHIYEKDGFNEKDFIMEYVDEVGEKIREYRVPSTSIYLYLYEF